MDNCFHNCYHDPSLGLTSICVEEQMSLLPMHLGNISGGVKQKLNSFIGSFSEKYGGTPISYKNVKILSDKGSIIEDMPHIHFRIRADFVLFKPIVGSRLKGVVNKVGKDHIGLLVHNRFNVCVPIVDNQMDSVVVSKGDFCNFTIVDIHLHRNLLSMTANNLQLG